MNIDNQQDIVLFMEQFKEITEWDLKNKKHCLTFKDVIRDGSWTLMLTNGQWSIRGKGKGYIDLEETYMARDEAKGFIWKNRLPIKDALLHTK